MHIIVGIDPGKTVGIACISLNGKLLHSAHLAFAEIGWIASEIRKVGTPSLIAGDKREVSEVVRRAAAVFNAKVFYPERDLGLEGKKIAGRHAGVFNPHERDAYTAALKAYNAYANKLNQAEHIANESGVNDIDSVKAKVIDRYSINEAILNRKANRQ
jgi:predicted RNase H-like nuclease (RuvC/YqgF family)